MTLTQKVDLTGLLTQVQDTLFDATDTICLERAELVARAYTSHADKPIPLKRALALDHLLSHMTLNLSANPVFAGNTSTRPRAWMLVPEGSWATPAQIFVEHDEFTPQWVASHIPQKLLVTWDKIGQSGQSSGIGHLSIDYGRVVSEGIAGVLSRLNHATDQTPQAKVYRQAMRIACDAIIKWSHRLADAAGELALSCDDPLRRACHERVASACRHVPQYPARNLFEALQSMMLIHLALALEGQGQSISIGLPDRALAGFSQEVEHDFENSVQLIRAFLVGIASNSYTGRGSKTQAITLGGRMPDGSDACNQLTLAFLDAFDQTAVADPHCFFRWHPTVNQKAWDKVIAMLSRGRSMPLLVNDQQVVPGLIDSGISLNDAWDYCMIGCNELGIPGRLSECSACYGLYFNDLSLLNDVLQDQPDRFANTQQLVDAWQDHFAQRCEDKLKQRVNVIHKHRQHLPMLISSAFCHGCAENGRDWVDGQRYHNPGAFTRGTANAINALAAINQLVFTERRYTLSQMLDLLAENDSMIFDAIEQTPKWGNDDQRADQWAVALGHARVTALETARKAMGNDHPPILLCHVVRSLHHLDGRNLGATPDGRRAREPVGDSIAGICGKTTQGPTAILNSVLKINALTEFRGIYNNNLTLPGNQASPVILKPLVRAFFMDGGQELQVNVLDASKLKAAKDNPAAYKDLVVRIAGLNARFIELSHAEQDEIIRRAELA